MPGDINFLNINISAHRLINQDLDMEKQDTAYIFLRRPTFSGNIFDLISIISVAGLLEASTLIIIRKIATTRPADVQYPVSLSLCQA